MSQDAAMTYDPANVFAKILRGELPCHKIFEDEQVLSFMDLMPQAEGHALVIPKVPSRNLLDADTATLVHLLPAVQKLARAVKQAYGADGVTVIQFNEAASGQSVYHLHFHVIPRFAGVPLKPHGGAMAPAEVLAAGAERIRKEL